MILSTFSCIIVLPYYLHYQSMIPDVIIYGGRKNKTPPLYEKRGILLSVHNPPFSSSRITTLEINQILSLLYEKNFVVHNTQLQKFVKIISKY